MSPFAFALTSALVDFVWQGTLVGLALAVALRALTHRSAQARYGWCTAALLLLMAVPLATTALRYDSLGPQRLETIGPRDASEVGRDERFVAFPAGSRQSVAALVRFEPWILPVWTVGVFLLSFRLVIGGIEVRALRRSGARADDGLREVVSRLAARMRISRDVHVATSPRAEGPSVIGWLRPLILLPPATVIGLTADQLEAVLAHELAHVRRHDYLVNIIQMLAETLLFYHPAVWWVSKRMRIERELCCDDEAVEVCGDATLYARALVTMARVQVPVFAMGSAGGSLSDRVRRLLGLGPSVSRRPAALGAVVIALSLVLTVLAIDRVAGQIERPRFEVASVKPAAPDARGFTWVEFLPGGVVRSSHAPILFMIFRAYEISWRQLDGRSELLDERFAIDARAGAGALPPPGATLMQTFERETPILREMLKTLLADRFKLVLHPETRDSPIYTLTVSPNGHKLKRAARDCSPQTLEEFSTSGPCGFQGGGPARGFTLRDAEIASLTSMLSTFLDRQVVDRTGITGRFDIDVPPWNPGTRRPPNPESDQEPQPSLDDPSIFTVLQEFGLRLESSRGPVVFYVIDHVERPSPN